MDLIVQAAQLKEITIRLSRSGEATGHRNTGAREVADHLAEGCVLAPHMLHIMDAELIEGNYVLYQGDLSTYCVGKSSGRRNCKEAVPSVCDLGLQPNP